VLPPRVVITPASRPTSLPADGQVQLAFPDNIEVSTLVDYVSKRLGMNIIFQDDSLSKRRVRLLSPTRIPKDSLLGVLQMVLKISGLAMVDAEQPGWKKIVPSPEAPNMLPSI
jgi:type II secretory pathway component GspD/PulD (secretin)